MDPNKYRKYNIVFQNVNPEKCQPILENYVKTVKEYTMSIEPNPKSDGFHAHLSVEFKNQRRFKAVLKELEKLKVSFIARRPTEGEFATKGDWGRVQLDRMRGTFQQNTNYLLGATKDKPLGEVKSGKKYPGEIIQRILADAMNRFYENLVDHIPQICHDYDEEYGNGFSDACYYWWIDDYGNLKSQEEIDEQKKNLRTE